MMCGKYLKRYFTAPDTASPRINNFNMIRLLAALMVMYGHMSYLMGTTPHIVFGQNVSTVGVKIFFIISGYLITKSYRSDSHFGRYMVRRSFRIFPGLIVVTLVTVLTLGPIFTTLSIGEYFRSPGTRFYLLNAVLYPVFNLPGVFVDYTYPCAVNGSLWSLPVEFFTYLFMPFVLLLCKKLKQPRFGILAAALLFLGLDVARNFWFPEFRLVIWGSNLPDALALIPFFFAGSFLSFPESKKLQSIQISAAMLLCCALISAPFAVMEVLLFFALPYFVISFALVERPVFGNWFSTCDFSYGLYLYAFPIQQILYHYLEPFDVSLNGMLGISFIVTLGFAMLSWYLVESPAQKLAKRVLATMKKEPKQEESPAREKEPIL